MIVHASVVVARVLFVAVVEDDILLPRLSLSSSAKAARQTFGVCLFFAHSLLAPPQQKRNSSCLRSDVVVDEKIWTSTTVTSLLLLSFVVGCCAYFRGAKEKTR